MRSRYTQALTLVCMVAFIAILAQIQPTTAQGDPPAASVPVMGALHIIPFNSTLLGAQWAADNSAVLTWSSDARLRRFDPATGALITERSLALEPTNVVLSHDTTRLVAWHGRSMAIQTSSGPSTVRLLQAPTDITGAQWSFDQQRLWTWHPDGTLLGWDVSPGHQGSIAIRVEHTHPIDRVRFKPDESMAVLESWSGQGAIVDFERQSVTPFTQQTAALVGGVWLNNGALYSWGWDGSLWSQPRGRITQRVQTAARFWDAVVSGDTLLTPTASGSVLLWDTDTLRPRASLQHEGLVTGLSSTADVVLTTATDGTARVWALVDGTPRYSFVHGEVVRGGQLSTDGTQFWTIAADNTLRLHRIPAAGTCYVTALANVNQRAAPNASSAFIETLAAYTSRLVNGATTGGAGFQWWQLDNGAWVREDVVLALPPCHALSLK